MAVKEKEKSFPGELDSWKSQTVKSRMQLQLPITPTFSYRERRSCTTQQLTGRLALEYTLESNKRDPASARRKNRLPQVIL